MDRLVPPNRYSGLLRSLTILKRIDGEYPILVREPVAKKLSKIAEVFYQRGILLQIDGGFRSLKSQKRLFRLKTKELGYKKAHELVHDPKRGISGHATGGAVDISLLTREGKEINLSSPFKKYYEEAKLYSRRITKRAQKLRLLLHEMMLKEGFAPNPNEYWHFSYGDNAWAKYYRRKPVYGEVNEDREVKKYPTFYNLFFKFLRLVWRILNKLFRFDESY